MKLSPTYYDQVQIRNFTIKLAKSRNLLKIFAIDELESIGNLAWVMASKKFDKNKGFQFSTFLGRFILNELFHELYTKTRHKKILSRAYYLYSDDLEIQSIEYHDMLEILNDRQREIMTMYWKGYTMLEISKKFSVSKNRIQQIIKVTRKILQKELR